jgi:ATP-dependent helicase/nuclease subunit A
MSDDNILQHFDDPISYITNNIDLPMSIEASAGCGKTYALIARVCALLHPPDPTKAPSTTIERCLLLTFTENAAAEMKARLISALLAHKEEQWAQLALSNLHRASIQTIHSFAYEVCSQFHDALGLPDEISLIDDIEKAQSLQSFFDRRYNEWGNRDELLDYFSICKALSLKRLTMQSVFSQLLSLSTHLPGDEYSPVEIDTFELPSCANLQNTAEKLIDAAHTVSSEKLNATQANRVESFTKLAHAITDTHTPREMFPIAFNPKRFISGKGFIAKEAKTHTDNYRNFEGCVAELGTEIKEFVNDVSDLVFRTTINLLSDLTRDYREEMFSSGYITFDDSIIAARRAVEIPAIREQLWARFDAVVIDEFQDTDVHQLAMVDLLSDEGSLGELARIFVVGDDKQSIYGFRGATVEGYKEFVRTRPINRVALDISRRSVPAVIEAINAFSEQLFSDYLPLVPYRENIEDDENYHVKIIGDEVEGSADDIRSAQAHDVISVLKDMKDSALIHDKDTGTQRPCQFSDMTVLIRDKNSLPTLTQSCDEYQVPYSVDSSALIWDVTLMRIFLGITSALYNPRNEFGVIAALKSSVFSIDNNDLVTYVQAQQNHDREKRSRHMWDYRFRTIASEDPHITRVSTALSDLNQWQNELPFMTPLEIVHKIMYSTQLYASSCSIFGESLTKGVTQFLVNEAIAYEDSHPSSDARSFCESLEIKRDSSTKSDTFIGTDNKNAIRIMTIHASKGLEFPVVAFLPSLATYQDRHSKVVELDDSYALSLSASKFDSRLASHKELLKDTFLDEESRLIYVALTRAQDHLVVATHHKPIKENKKAKEGDREKVVKAPTNQVELIKLGALKFSRYEPTEDPLHQIAPQQTDIHTSNNVLEFNNQYAPEREIKLQKQKRFTELLRDARSLSASSLKPESRPSPQRSTSFLSRSDAPALGKAVHRALNIIDFAANKETVDAMCRRCCLNEGLLDENEIEKSITMVTQALSLDILHDADRILREVPISGFVNNVFCEGYIDALAIKGDEYIIIDYKTDIVDANRPLEEKIEVHSRQLALYSLLVKSNLGARSTRAALAFLSNSSAPYIEIENLEIVEKEVLHLIEDLPV